MIAQMIANTTVTTMIAAVPGIIAGAGGVMLAHNAKRELKAKGEADYVTLTQQAAELVSERIEEVRTDYADLRTEHTKLEREHARCQRNIYRLRHAMLVAGLDVPDLE